MSVPAICTIELTLFCCEQRNKREQNWFGLHFLSSFPVRMQSPCSMCKKNHFIDRILSLQFQEYGVALTIVCEAGRLTGRLIDLLIGMFVPVCRRHKT